MSQPLILCNVIERAFQRGGTSGKIGSRVKYGKECQKFGKILDSVSCAASI